MTTDMEKGTAEQGMAAVRPAFESGLARMIADFSAQLSAHADRAVEAARDGRPRDAFLAAGAMQELVNAKAAALRSAMAAMQSKRVHPAIRAEIRRAAQPVTGGIVQQVRTLEAMARAGQARLDAIGTALRADTRGPLAYTAQGVAPTARPTLAVSA
jgi:hypothetical protein